MPLNYLICSTTRPIHLLKLSIVLFRHSHELFQRKYEIIRRATEGHVIWNTPVERGWNRGETQTHFRNQGWWDGSSDWDTTFRNHFRNGPGSHLNRNSIRPFTIDFFVTAPQEAYATLGKKNVTVCSQSDKISKKSQVLALMEKRFHIIVSYTLTKF